MSVVQLNTVFTIDEQIQFLEKRGWKIEKKEKDIWIQTGPYDRVGEVQHQVKYYASKPELDNEEMDRVFSREAEKIFKQLILNQSSDIY